MSLRIKIQLNYCPECDKFRPLKNYCSHDPKTVPGTRFLGMYHCPLCSDMQLATTNHTQLCAECIVKRFGMKTLREFN